MERSRSRTQIEPPAVDLARMLPLGDLLALGTQIRADITPEMLLQDVAEALQRVFGLPHVYVRLRNPDTDELEACAFAGLDDDEVARLRATPLAPAHYQALLQPRYRLSESFLVPVAGPAAPAPDVAGSHAQASLMLPLRGRGDRLLGAICVEPVADPASLDPSSVRVLEAIARQAALALENARLAARTQRLLAKEQLLVEIGRDVSATLDLPDILARALDHLRETFPSCAVALLSERGELEIASSYGLLDAAAHEAPLRPDEGICGWVAQHGMPFLSNDVQNETRVAPAVRDIGRSSRIRSYIAVPLRSGGKVIGTLSAHDERRDAFTYEDVDLLEAVSAQLGGPIASAQLYQEAQRLSQQVRRRNTHLELINMLARMAVSTLDIQRMLTIVTAQIQQGLGYAHVEVYTTAEDESELLLAAQAGPLGRGGVGERRPLGQGLIGWAYRTAATVRVADLASELGAASDPPETRSQLCVPIMAGGRVLALLNLESRRVAAFSDEDVATLETIADVLASAIENARLYQRAQAAAVLEERSRLARDLHDSISQQLFSMTLTAQAARSQLEKNPMRSAAQLERLQETAAAALAEMRALIFQLRPPGLLEQGLIATMQQHVAMLRRREDLTVDLVVSGEERYARGIEQAMYRIAQEALNNVLKHAGACRVAVDLALGPEEVRLRIADDGRGFNLSAPVGNGRHLGLTSMRERAAEIGGRLDLHSSPGGGTEIVVVVPRVGGV